jgi:capsular polysaccharide biosynthesis protein
MLRVTLFDRLDDLLFLVPPVLQPWHRGLFEVAGIKPEQIVPADESFTCVEELMACHIATEGSMPRREMLERFRKLALANAVPTPPTRRNRRIFIDRSAAKRRKTANQKELEPVLKERGFEIVQWEQLSMMEQVRLAAETEIMAGPHGTSLLNSIYSQPGIKLLEIINPYWWDAATLRQCTLLGHEFWYCFGENVSRDHDTAIAPKKLARVLDYMLEAPVTDPLFDEVAKYSL